MKSVDDLGDLRGKRVVIRCDFNVPLDGDKITDDGPAPTWGTGPS